MNFGWICESGDISPGLVKLGWNGYIDLGSVELTWNWEFQSGPISVDLGLADILWQQLVCPGNI